jgi:hypothetical protein
MDSDDQQFLCVIITCIIVGVVLLLIMPIIFAFLNSLI